MTGRFPPPNRNRPKPVFLYAMFACIALVLSGSVCGPTALADAVVATRAMQATTIAQVFVEDDYVRVELEIGARNLGAFRDFFPPELLKQLSSYIPIEGPNSDPGTRRRLSIYADDANELHGSVRELKMRRRIIRDEITGDPVPEQPEDADHILHAVIDFPFGADVPERLMLEPPLLKGPADERPNIGFVAYHKGLPINEFRYLVGGETLLLNWEDPWYSRFTNPNLRRKNSAPMEAYLYIEPHEVRKEIVLRPRDLQAFVDLGLQNADSILIGQQDRIKDEVGEFLARKNPIMIDGEVAEGHLDRIHFIRRSLIRTGIIDPPEDLDLTSATLGVIFVYPTRHLPNEVTMRWELFNDSVSQLPAAASDEAGAMPSTLTPSDPTLRWKNYLKNPTLSAPIIVPPPPLASVFRVPVLSVILISATLVLASVIIRRYAVGKSFNFRSIGMAVCLIVAALATSQVAVVAMPSPFAEQRSLTEGEATEVLQGLLYNVYRAFDRREAGAIYDQLETGIAGELLEQVYLETLQSIEIENQGGLRIAVKDVEILELNEEGASGGLQPTFRCTWRVSGSVGHWGHLHQRDNKSTARIKLAPIDGRWKITAMQVLLEDEPIQPGDFQRG